MCIPLGKDTSSSSSRNEEGWACFSHQDLWSPSEIYKSLVLWLRFAIYRFEDGTTSSVNGVPRGGNIPFLSLKGGWLLRLEYELHEY